MELSKEQREKLAELSRTLSDSGAPIYDVLRRVMHAQHAEAEALKAELGLKADVDEIVDIVAALRRRFTEQEGKK